MNARTPVGTCPAWCATDHTTPEATRVAELARVRVHTRTVAVIDRGDRTVARVEVTAFDDLKSGDRDPVEVVVEARDAYTAEEAERVAAALVEAARFVRGAA